MAAHYFFHNEDIELICCSTFEEVFATVKDDSTILGMAAIENTIAGSLLHNYELLCDSGLTIVGEHKLRISHSLLCLPDDNLEDITEVHSHPVALMQCREFLARHPRLKVVEGEDTAGSAEIISREQLRGQAAICSKFAAPLYCRKASKPTNTISPVFWYSANRNAPTCCAISVRPTKPVWYSPFPTKKARSRRCCPFSLSIN